MLKNAINAYFYGCWRDSGHYLWTPALFMHERLPSGWTWGIDGHFVPKEHGVVAHRLTQQGDPIPLGWTVLSMIDNTVDPRPGSHATFVLLGQFSDLVSASGRVYAHFPKVAERVDLLAAVQETLNRGRRT